MKIEEVRIDDICNRIGLEPEELLKLKHITGFSALFKDIEYSKAWETRKMAQIRLQQKSEESEGELSETSA